MKRIFHDRIEKMSWEACAKGWPPAYLYAQMLGWAMQRIGEPLHRGTAWAGKVATLAQAALVEVGVTVEHYAGNLYIAGKRVWQDHNGHWQQDEYRP